MSDKLLFNFSVQAESSAQNEANMNASAGSESPISIRSSANFEPAQGDCSLIDYANKKARRSEPFQLTKEEFPPGNPTPTQLSTAEPRL
jgi:hypothetical protein